MLVVALGGTEEDQGKRSARGTTEKQGKFYVRLALEPNRCFSAFGGEKRRIQPEERLKNYVCVRVYVCVSFACREKNPSISHL